MLAEFIYNNSVHSSIGVSPFFAVYGMNLEIRLNVEDAITGGEAVAAHERACVISDERDMLDKY